MTTPTISVNKIKVGERYRKDMGDIDALAASIDEVGFLQPIAIRPDDTLVAGARRVEAAKKLGMDIIPVRVVHNLDEALAFLKAERDENTCRKDFTRSEAVAIGKAIEELEKPKAEARKKEHGGTAPGKPKNTGGNLPPVKSDNGKTRDKVGEAVGMSGRTYQKAKAVVVAAEKEPELKLVVEEMDRTGNVDAAYKKVKDTSTQTKEGKKKRGRPPTNPGAIILANKACDVMRQIPENDPQRKRGFQIVADWLKDNL